MPGFNAYYGEVAQVSPDVRGKIFDELTPACTIIDKAVNADRLLTDDEAATVEKHLSRVDALRESKSAGEHGDKLIGRLREEVRSKREHISAADKARIAASLTDLDPAKGLIFKDAATGQTQRALRANEPICKKPVDDGEPHIVGRAVQAWLTGRMEDNAPRGLQLGSSDTSGGFFMEPTLSQMVLDLARANSVCAKAGMQTVTMNSNELNLVRVTSDPTPHWRPEGATTTASGVTFGRVTLKSRTLACIVPVTLEMIEDSPNAAQVIEDCMASAIASEIDRVCLVGTGDSGNEPRGLRYTTGTNRVADVGTPSSYSEVTEGVGEILNSNYSDELNKLAWVSHPIDGKAYADLCDTTGQPLQPGPWVAPLKKLYTSSMPQNEGSGAESSMVVGDFREVLLGVRRSGVVMRRISSGTVTDSAGTTYNAASQLLEHLVVHTRVDVAVMRPAWFCWLTGLQTS